MEYLMTYITEILKQPIIQLVIGILAIALAQKFGVPVTPLIKKYFGISNGNNYAKKEDIKTLLEEHKADLKTNDFLHIGEDLGEIKQMLKDSKEWQKQHAEEDDKRFELLFKKIK